MKILEQEEDFEAAIADAKKIREVDRKWDYSRTWKFIKRSEWFNNFREKNEEFYETHFKSKMEKVMLDLEESASEKKFENGDNYFGHL